MIDKLIELGKFLEKEKENIKDITCYEDTRRDVLIFSIFFNDTAQTLGIGTMYYKNTYCEVIIQN